MGKLGIVLGDAFLGVSVKERELIRKKRRKKTEKKNRKQEWYEKFHWFFSSEDFLCIGGKDATSNEIIIKKHTEKILRDKSDVFETKHKTKSDKMPST